MTDGMDKVSVMVYPDDPAYPSSPGSTSRVTIKVAKQNRLSFGDGAPGQRLKMTIEKPKLLGMKSGGQNDRVAFVQRMILACNLILERARLSTDPADTSVPGYYSDAGKSGYARTYVEDGRMVFEARDVVRVSDHWEITGIMDDTLDEERACDALRMICTVSDLANPTKQAHNLAKSLEAYGEGITSRHRRTVYRNLFMALEMAVNSDSEHRGEDFDLKVSGIAGCSASQIERLRHNPYNRLKHPARHENDVTSYPDDDKVARDIRELRMIASKCILLKLQEVVAGASGQGSASNTGSAWYRNVDRAVRPRTRFPV